MSKIPLDHLVTRAPEMEDASAVAGLINICAVLEASGLQMTVRQLRESWQTPDFDLATDAWLITEPDGLVVGYAEVRYGDPYEGPCFQGCVHPSYAGRGLGTYLVRWVEGRAQQALTNAPQGGCVVLRTGAVSVNQEARRLLYQAGFRLARRFWRTVKALDALARAPEYLQNGQDDRAVYRYDVYEKELHPRTILSADGRKWMATT